ncbi:MAG TPA: serine hydrolase domain-containing protein [Pyrinomonadaceae bacterium]|nr:serine hydrolase domain-containing protein [Pyrinomonadaceae bacterium]
MRLTSKLLAAFALLLCVGAQTLADEVDRRIEAQMRKRHVPGLSLAVLRGGKIIKARGYGFANLELQVAATPETVFEVGSLTKQFTAAAVMLLVEEGKVSLDDPAGKHLAGLPDVWGGVTVRHLLTHTSGIKTYVGTTGFELSRRLSGDEFIKAAGALPLLFEPGTSWDYSNTNFNLLGHLVERVSGQPFWQFLEERIFRPLGMSATRYNDHRKIVPLRADGYFFREGGWTKRDPPLWDVGAAGALLSTAHDLAKWAAALEAGKVLKPSSLEQMWTPVRVSGGASYPYGFGWSVETFRGHRLLSHGGLMAGFSAYVARYPEERLTVVVLCNLANLREFPPAGRIGIAVASAFLPSLALDTLKEITDAEPRTTSTLRGALAGFLEGEPDASHFTPPTFQFLTSERGKALRAELAAHGPLNSFALLERKETGAERTYLYRATLGRDKVYLSFTLAGGKIAGMRLEEE